MRKRIGLFFMVLSLVFLPRVVVRAANGDVIDGSKAGSITIHKYDMTGAKDNGVDLTQFTATGKQDLRAEESLGKYAISGVEFSYVRVGAVEQKSEDGSVILIYEVPDELQRIVGLDDSDAERVDGDKRYFSSQKINEELRKALEDSVATKDRLEDYCKQHGEAMNLTDEQGVSSVSGLELGLYLVVETKVPENVVDTTNPFFVQLPMTDTDGDDWFYDVVCYPKNQTGMSTLTKKVKSDPDEATYGDSITASEGEVLDYQLVSKLPHVTSKATYITSYTFKDTLTKGISYGKDAVVAIYDSEDAISKTDKNNVDSSGAIAAWKSSDSSLKFQTEYGKDGTSSTMKVSFTAAGLQELNQKYADKYLAIYYTGTMNSDNQVVMGDQGNPNDVSLTWKRTNEDKYDILEDDTIAYTYGLDVTKRFSDDNGDPTKVKFVLENTTDHYYITAIGSQGVYHVTGKAKSKEEATSFTLNSEGKLTISGIEGDTYDLTETHTDTGYSVLKKAIVVKIQDKVATVDGKTATFLSSQNSQNALVTIEITNSKSFLLPKTGGKGIYMLTIVGILLSISGCYFLRKKKDE